jgi:hypothetical protein
MPHGPESSDAGADFGLLAGEAPLSGLAERTEVSNPGEDGSTPVGWDDLFNDRVAQSPGREPDSLNEIEPSVWDDEEPRDLDRRLSVLWAPLDGDGDALVARVLDRLGLGRS